MSHKLLTEFSLSLENKVNAGPVIVSTNSWKKLASFSSSEKVVSFHRDVEGCHVVDRIRTHEVGREAYLLRGPDGDVAYTASKRSLGCGGKYEVDLRSQAGHVVNLRVYFLEGEFELSALSGSGGGRDRGIHRPFFSNPSIGSVWKSWWRIIGGLLVGPGGAVVSGALSFFGYYLDVRDAPERSHEIRCDMRHDLRGGLWIFSAGGFSESHVEICLNFSSFCLTVDANCLNRVRSDSSKR